MPVTMNRQELNAPGPLLLQVRTMHSHLRNKHVPNEMHLPLLSPDAGQSPIHAFFHTIAIGNIRQHHDFRSRAVRALEAGVRTRNGRNSVGG